MGNDAIFTWNDDSDRENHDHENHGREKGIGRVHQDYLTCVSTEAEPTKQALASWYAVVREGTRVDACAVLLILGNRSPTQRLGG